MGVETLIGLGLSAAGAAYNAKQQQDTAKRQNDTAVAGLMQQAADQKQANAAVNQTVQKVAGSTPEAAREASLNSFLTQLQQSRAQANGDGTAVTGSNRYATDKASANADTANFGARTADLLSRITAPGMQRQQEGQAFAQLGSDVGTIQRQSQADQFLEELRQRSIQPNPWGSALASTLSGAGAGLSSYAGTKAPKIKSSKTGYVDSGDTSLVDTPGYA